ncbi:MAG: type II toxin-antitoxin system RelE/ParE family toxin [Rickettsiales bacterium]|jgi:putative addiction module killer protein|nr:type II toxin-antitoxin system RelE/ParE family toxin [Rickettsiales bacterium]
MIEILTTEAFDDWIAKLKDTVLKAKILGRLNRIALGNFGDHKSVGEGVLELRFTYASGYRIYYTKQGNKIVILLCGGDKSTQTKDIKRAKELASEVKNG